MKVVSATQMREIDRTAIEERGVSGLELMERAGQAVTDEILLRFAPETVAIVTGKGNNAGDGFVVARQLAEKGVRVRCALLADPAGLSGDAAANFARLPAAVEQRRVESRGELDDALAGMAVVVDAILGTGIKGAVRGLFGEAIAAINAAAGSVVAIDIPTGLPTDGQAPEGECVRAALTVTMGLPKIGMAIYPGYEFTGQLVVADIGFPRDLLTDESIRLNVIDEELARAALPPRRRDSHKGTYGSAFLIAGSRGMTGAAILAARAALRSGAGLVFAGLPARTSDVFEASVAEALSIPLPSVSGDYLDGEALNETLAQAARMDAVALGPGLGRHPGTQQFVRDVVQGLEKPLVIDADGLNALAGESGIFAERPAPTILTPHPGEMARLTGGSVTEIQADRLGVAEKCAAAWGVHLILKGAQSVVATPGGELFINPTGNSGLAKGGSGDVLTGLLAGLLAQGAAPLAACLAGVYLHGLAGELAAREFGVRAVVAGDVVDKLGAAFLTLERR